MKKTSGEANSSLSEVNASIDTQQAKGFWKKLLAFLGPAYMVSVGYMDPGNWATDIAGGSKYGYTLIWVLLMSNLIALLLQSHSARLGIVRGQDLAQASRETYHPVINFALYILAEIAIAACDLAEVLGMAIGLQLLFDLPLLWGVCISVLDTFLLLILMGYGIRKLEAFIISLIAIIGISFLVEMIFAHPEPAELVKGFIPSIPDHTALYIAIGIIGATVMPHNLYLHSSLVQTRKFSREKSEIKKAIKFNFIDSTIALNLAFFVNAAILILAASAFFRNGYYEVSEIQDAHRFLAPILGTQWAPILFAVALIAAGQSSTITGTLAGQIVMEGYLDLRIQPWIRRLITRLIAIVPAFLTIYFAGENSTGSMLVLSQVILSLQLGFAIIPLIHFVSNKRKMGDFVISRTVKVLSWIAAMIIVGLNIKLVGEQIIEWLHGAGELKWVIEYIVLPIALIFGFLLFYITIEPLLQKRRYQSFVPHQDLKSIETSITEISYEHIAICLDFSASDKSAINHAIGQGGKKAAYTLIHIVETPGAYLIGKETQDMESEYDKKLLLLYAEYLTQKGYTIHTQLGFGVPSKVIPNIINENNISLLVMGVHGHKGLKDLLFGTTIDAVRHAIKVPLLLVHE